MVKITKCDRCGKEFVGRNPEGFAEHVINHRVYVDLCNECNNHYDNLIRTLQEDYDSKIQNFLNEVINK